MTSHPAPPPTPTSGPPPLKKQRSVTGGENIDPNVAAATRAPVYLRFKERPPGADVATRKQVKLAEVLDPKVLDKLKPLCGPEVRGQLKRCEEKLSEEMVEFTYRQVDTSKCVADTGYEGKRVVAWPPQWGRAFHHRAAVWCDGYAFSRPLPRTTPRASLPNRLRLGLPPPRGAPPKEVTVRDLLNATGLSREEYERAIIDIMRGAEAPMPVLAGVREEVRAAYKATNEVYPETVRVLANLHKVERSKKPHSGGVSLWWFLLGVIGAVVRSALLW